MLRLAFLVLLLVSLWLRTWLPLSAQEPNLETWTMAIWPEFDQPSVLVISEGTLSDESALPLTLRVPIPAGVQMNAVAYKDEDGRLFSIPWEVAAAGSGQEVVFELDQPTFVVEYYADVISPPPDRSFELPLTVPYDTRSAMLLLRQPTRASDMTIEPALEPNGLDGLGNPQYSQELGAQSAGTVIPLAVGYTKADTEPSIGDQTALPEVNAAPAPDQALPNWVSWAIGILLGVLLAGVGVLAWDRFYRDRGGSSRQARRRRARTSGRGDDAGGGSNRFCPQCGQQYQSGDRFCRACGTPRR